MSPQVIPLESAPLTQYESPNKKKNHLRVSKWSQHQFTCFDGEGYDIDGRHQYVYLAAYDGTHYAEVRNNRGLSTEQCFRFLVDTAKSHSHGINVIYGGSYDANMMLKDVSVPALMDLNKTGSCRWKHWRIYYQPRKSFTVIDLSAEVVSGDHGKRRPSCKLWDVIGFFQCTFETALEDWLDVTDETIAKGKKSRKAFSAKELDFIIAYCKTELRYFEQLMQRLWHALDSVGIKLTRWDGAGAAAQAVLQGSNILLHKGTQEQNDQHYREARIAYAGGRFELIAPGDYQCPVYNYDINSAYPYAMTMLPPFSGLRECKRKNCDYGPYDLLKIHYQAGDDGLTAIHPYHHRHSHHAVSYPMRTVGWHYGVEWIGAGKAGEVLAHLHWDDSGLRPFEWVRTFFDYRLQLKAARDKAEKAVKLSLNSLYGKCVQQKGWMPGKKKPLFHQLYWGGWITAYTRSMIYQAMMQHPESVIAVETDGIFTTKPLDLDIGTGLGQWDLKVFDDITYVQNGVYFATHEGKEVARYRGFDKGTLTREKVLVAWEKLGDSLRGIEAGTLAATKANIKVTVKARCTRFRTLSTSLQSDRIDNWCQWITEPRELALVASGKRPHYSAMCEACRTMQGYKRGTHHLTRCAMDKNIISYPYNVLWDDTNDKQEYYLSQDQQWESDISGH